MMLDLAMLARLRARLLDLLAPLAFLGPLLARLTVGLVFIKTGWGKLHSLDDVTEFFRSLHIPAPAIQARVVATLEFFGGSLVLVGLFTRLAALPLIGTMVVAIWTAKLGDLETWSSLLHLEEWLYLIVFAWLVLAGPGKVSLDHVLARRLLGVAKGPSANL